MKLNIKNNNETKNVQNAQVNDQSIAEPIEDAVVVSESSPTPDPSPQGKGGKKKGAPKKSAPKNETPNFSVVTYTTKKGGTAGYVMGFKDEQAAKVVADAACKTVGVTWRYNDQGAKVYGLSFGTRYMDVASALCEALNKGDKAAVSKAIAKTHDVYAAAVEAGNAEREANRKAKKAEEAKAKAKELAKVKKANGLYSMEDIAAMMKRAMAGEDVPELAAVKEAMGLAA